MAGRIEATFADGFTERAFWARQDTCSRAWLYLFKKIILLSGSSGNRDKITRVFLILPMVSRAEKTKPKTGN
jgi:hypothetical protein